MDNIDYYNILGIGRNATTDEIKKAFRKLEQKYHLDKNKQNENTNREFAEIYEAYQTLTDLQRRSEYDRYGNTEQFKQDERQRSQQDRHLKDAAVLSEREECKKKKSSFETWQLSIIFGIMFMIFFIIDMIPIVYPIYAKYKIKEKSELSIKEYHKERDTIVLVENLLATFGPTYLYTNDSAALVKLMPDTKGEAYRSGEDRKAFNASFLQKPDQIGVVTVITTGTQHMLQATESALHKGIGKLELQFMFYDLVDEMPHRTIKLRDTTFDVSSGRNYSMAYRINFNDKLEIKENMQGFTPFSLLKIYRNLKVYMTVRAARDKTMQVDLSNFKYAISVVNKRLHQLHIDTTAFKLSVFNR